MWDNLLVPEWLEKRGAVTVGTIQGLTSTLHAEIKRANMLTALEPICRSNRWHWPLSWAAKERPRCALCGFVGYASQPLHSLRRTCGAWDASTVSGTDLTNPHLLALAKDIELATTRVASLRKLLRGAADIA